MWQPRPILGEWTPDQQRIAAHFPAARRVAVTAANGVGKTYLAADLVVSFLQQPEAVVITTGPTARQVEGVLWPEIWKRLRQLELAEEDHARAEWEGPDGQSAKGFATNRAERMQGYHAAKLLVIVDEGSGVAREMFEAIEGICVGEENYVFVIGNPNEPIGPFYELCRPGSQWEIEELSALTHPNIMQRREVIPGATTWRALSEHLRDWCRVVDEPTPETFTIDGVHYLPNDAFRVRFLGRWPAQASNALFNPAQLSQATDRAVFSDGYCIAALDVARTGGDRTVYTLRQGNAVTCIQIIEPGDLPTQAEAVGRLLVRDNPKHITIDAAGLGIGLIDYLRRITTTPVREFQGSAQPISEAEQKKYYNKRAAAYGHLATAIARGNTSLPNEPELLEELERMTYTHKPNGTLIITSKDEYKSMGYRSPDLADGVSMLFEQPTVFGMQASPAVLIARPAQVEF